MTTTTVECTQRDQDATLDHPMDQSAMELGTEGIASMPAALKLLIVDDSDVVRERLAAQVGEVQRVALVGQAADGPAAMHLFQEQHPDVVVLDIELPGTSGFELLTRMKRQRPACVVIMLSNFASGPFRLGCNRLGADFFFSKSSEFERITDVLEAIISAQTPTL